MNLIGGSALPDILSLPPYGCQRRLWLRDTGQQPDYPESKPGALARGIWGEAAAAQVYAEVTGRKLRRMGLVVSRDCPEFGGHPDRRIVTCDDRGPGLLEAKCPGEYEFLRVRREGLHLAHIVQLQWYLYLAVLTWGAYAVFSLERWELIHFDVARDEALILSLVAAAHQYRRIRDNGPAPERLDAHDKRCGRCVYRTTCQGAALVALLGEGTETLDVDLGLSPLVAEYLDARSLVAEAEDVLAEARAPLELALGDRQAVETAGARVYWRAHPGRQYWDGQALDREHPELAATYKRRGAPTRPLLVYPI